MSYSYIKPYEILNVHRSTWCRSMRILVFLIIAFIPLESLIKIVHLLWRNLCKILIRIHRWKYMKTTTHWNLEQLPIYLYYYIKNDSFSMIKPFEFLISTRSLINVLWFRVWFRNIYYHECTHYSCRYWLWLKNKHIKEGLVQLDLKLLISLHLFNRNGSHSRYRLPLYSAC